MDDARTFRDIAEVAEYLGQRAENLRGNVSILEQSIAEAEQSIADAKRLIAAAQAGLTLIDRVQMGIARGMDEGTMNVLLAQVGEFEATHAG